MEVLEAAVDRLGRAVRSAGPVEAGEPLVVTLLAAALFLLTLLQNRIGSDIVAIGSDPIRSDSKEIPMEEQTADRTSMADQVYETLMDRLISGSIAPTSRLSVDALARDLGVSQTPIRRAMTLLEAEGLVTSSYLSGYTASAKLTLAEFEDLFEVRMLLEPPASARAAINASDEELDAIAKIADEMTTLRDTDPGAGYSGFARLDSQFHQAIVDASGSAILARSISSLHAHVHMFRLMFDASITHDAIDEHAEIVDALRGRREDDAALATARHLASSHDRLVAAFPARA